jgi:hypothetical protein
MAAGFALAILVGFPYSRPFSISELWRSGVAVWLVGLIVLFFFYALCVVAAKREPPAPAISNVKSEIPNGAARETPRLRRRDREKILRVLHPEGRRELPEEIRAA